MVYDNPVWRSWSVCPIRIATPGWWPSGYVIARLAEYARTEWAAYAHARGQIIIGKGGRRQVFDAEPTRRKGGRRFDRCSQSLGLRDGEASGKDPANLGPDDGRRELWRSHVRILG